MNRHALCAALTLALTAGCATQGGQRPAWSIEPVVSVRHGMSEGRAAYELGRRHHARGRQAEAEAAYLRAADDTERRPEALSALAALYAERGELERSVQTLERAVSLEPLVSRLHGNLGYALMLTGRVDDAADALKRAVRLDRDNRHAWRNLAEAYRRIGAPAEAEQAAAAARGIWPEDTGTPAARPMPFPPDMSGARNAPEAVVQHPAPPVTETAPAPHSPAPPPSEPIVARRMEARLVKVGENVLELRIPSGAPAGAGEQAAR